MADRVEDFPLGSWVCRRRKALDMAQAVFAYIHNRNRGKRSATRERGLRAHITIAAIKHLGMKFMYCIDVWLRVKSIGNQSPGRVVSNEGASDGPLPFTLGTFCA